MLNAELQQTAESTDVAESQHSLEMKAASQSSTKEQCDETSLGGASLTDVPESALVTLSQAQDQMVALRSNLASCEQLCVDLLSGKTVQSLPQDKSDKAAAIGSSSAVSASQSVTVEDKDMQAEEQRVNSALGGSTMPLYSNFQYRSSADALKPAVTQHEPSFIADDNSGCLGKRKIESSLSELMAQASLLTKAVRPYPASILLCLHLYYCTSVLILNIGS